MKRQRKPLPPLPPTLDELVPSVESETPFEVIAEYVQRTSPRFDQYEDYALPVTAGRTSLTPDIDLPYVDLPPTDFSKLAPADDTPGDQAKLYFGIDPVGAVRESIAPWRAGEAPEIVAPERAPAPRPKLAALGPPAQSADVAKPAQSVAPKGEVTGTAAAADVSCRAPQVLPIRRAPRPRSAWPMPSISSRAANRCAARSRSRRWS